jgi:hypothetical protein
MYRRQTDPGRPGNLRIWIRNTGYLSRYELEPILHNGIRNFRIGQTLGTFRVGSRVEEECRCW